MAIPFHFKDAPTGGHPLMDVAEENGGTVDEMKYAGEGNDRSCGDCQACCIDLPIPAGEVCPSAKPAGVKCPHLDQNGCRIYQQRPTTCRQFQCVWLDDPSWPLAWRPDRSGLLCLREEIDNGVSAALVYEIESGVGAPGTTEAVLTKLQESTAVVAVVNAQRQRRLLRGRQWVEPGDPAVRRPHFLMPIHTIGADSEAAARLRDAS